MHMQVFIYLRHTMSREKKYEIPLLLIALEDENYHLLIDATFLNGENGKWVLDTGASKSVFDINEGVN
jgi:hypothetical protein